MPHYYSLTTAVNLVFILPSNSAFSLVAKPLVANELKVALTDAIVKPSTSLIISSAKAPSANFSFKMFKMFSCFSVDMWKN